MYCRKLANRKLLKINHLTATMKPNRHGLKSLCPETEWAMRTTCHIVGALWAPNPTGGWIHVLTAIPVAT
jgi:hypothetical protein